jgi:hypothetical protein
VAVNEGLKIPEMQASIAKLGMETRSFTAREFADKLVEEERVWAAAIRDPGPKSIDTLSPAQTSSRLELTAQDVVRIGKARSHNAPLRSTRSPVREYPSTKTIRK